jgi:tetratricopeptide (TPR) repeat protein
MGTPGKPTPAGEPARRAGARTWLARAALVVGVPLLFFSALEAGLRLAGYGRPATFFIPDAEPGYVRTNPEYASLFLPGNFDLRPLNFRIAARKPANTVRIVVLGESAAQGVPVPSFAFGPQLRAQLRSRYPAKEFEVVNTGIVAVNSHVVYQIAREMARYEPDLFLVYMGNNEVVGPYGPGCAYLSSMPPLWMIRASVWVRSTRTGQLLGALAARLARGGAQAREWGGMSMFVDSAVAGNDPRLGAVEENLRSNLRGIIDAAAGAGARTVLCTVVANLKDCPPFLSRNSPWLTTEALRSFRGAFDAGKLAWLLGDDRQARALLGRALLIDPTYAETEFLLGSLDLKNGDVATGRMRLVDALHWDALRFRPDPAINQVIREVAAERPGSVLLLDTARALGADPDSDAPPSGRELLFEHVHFDWAGNYRLARMMARGCASEAFGTDPGDGGWMTSDACAEALAYTGHERLPMLLRMDVLIRKPPFTNQVNHVVDEAAMARAIEAAKRDARDPATLERSLGVAKEALLMDPENPALAGILEGIKLDLGDDEGALVLARRAAELLPGDYALAADEASILLRLGKTDEAEKVLLDAARSGADLDLLAPVLSQLWTKSGRLDEGIAYLGAGLSRRPRDAGLRVALGHLRRSRGDLAGAEREYRLVLAADPSDDGALESLIGLLADAGRSDEGEKLSVSLAERQPRNQANSLRAVAASEALGDAEGAVRHMLAAERSGPVTSTFELTLALKLFQLQRPLEMMGHLAEARLLSQGEGNASVTESIDALIVRMRPLAAQAQKSE